MKHLRTVLEIQRAALVEAQAKGRIQRKEIEALRKIIDELRRKALA